MSRATNKTIVISQAIERRLLGTIDSARPTSQFRRRFALKIPVREGGSIRSGQHLGRRPLVDQLTSLQPEGPVAEPRRLFTIVGDNDGPQTRFCPAWRSRSATRSAEAGSRAEVGSSRARISGSKLSASSRWPTADARRPRGRRRRGRARPGRGRLLRGSSIKTGSIGSRLLTNDLRVNEVIEQTSRQRPRRLRDQADGRPGQHGQGVWSERSRRSGRVPRRDHRAGSAVGAACSCLTREAPIRT